MELDAWQKKVLTTRGNICLRSGRQVGKSTVVSIKAAEFAVKNPKKTVLIIASVERQSYLMLEKTLGYLLEKHKNMIKKGKSRPTKSKIELKNGSTIYSLPTGLTGAGIRGYTVDLLIADEAAFIPEEVWTAVTPMLSVTKGDRILLSTPHGQQGYFYDCFDDPTFSSFHISSEDCPRHTKEFLEHERKRLGDLIYTQEYLGEFIDEISQVFPDALIKSCMRAGGGVPRLGKTYFLGVDIAGLGKDESTFEVFELTPDRRMIHVYHGIMKRKYTTEITDEIVRLERKWNFKKIYIDDGGLGFGVYSELRILDGLKQKIVGLNNAKRVYQRDATGREVKEKAKTLLKEEMYNNLRMLMERKKVLLIQNDEVFQSLKSIQFHPIVIKDRAGNVINEKGMRYYGSYTHIVEGIIRAVWGWHEKGLNMYVVF